MNVYEIDIEQVRFTDDSLIFDLADGRSISAPLAYYPTLLNATVEQRKDFKIIHHMVYWPELDADLSSDCLLQGAREGASVRPLDAVAESPVKYRAEND
jgi:hypothetical protein